MTAKVWIMPVGAEILGEDGDQMFYATEDGAGSAVPVGWASEWVFSTDEEPER